MSDRSEPYWQMMLFIIIGTKQARTSPYWCFNGKTWLELLLECENNKTIFLCKYSSTQISFELSSCLSPKHHHLCCNSGVHLFRPPPSPNSLSTFQLDTEGLGDRAESCSVPFLPRTLEIGRQVGLQAQATGVQGALIA